jgi:hypothetical protein
LGLESKWRSKDLAATGKTPARFRSNKVRQTQTISHLGRRGCTRAHGSEHGFDAAMRYKHPLKKVLSDNQNLWDVESTPRAARDAFNKVLHCGTAALGAEVYSSGIEDRVVFHTCKGRACSSCGARATSQWQRERWAALPDVQYKGITFTMPDVLWPLFRNRKLARVLPVLAAKTVEAWVRAKFGLRVGVIAILHTFNGKLEFNAHVHLMVTAGGLDDSGAWIPSVYYPC